MPQHRHPHLEAQVQRALRVPAARGRPADPGGDQGLPGREVRVPARDRQGLPQPLLGRAQRQPAGVGAPAHPAAAEPRAVQLPVPVQLPPVRPVPGAARAGLGKLPRGARALARACGRAARLARRGERGGAAVRAPGAAGRGAARGPGLL
nr:MAG: hypothetical protein [Molluscum contagiosum virus]